MGVEPLRVGSEMPISRVGRTERVVELVTSVDEKLEGFPLLVVTVCVSPLLPEFLSPLRVS